MFVPDVPLADVSVLTKCWIESKAPSADSTMYSTATATNRMMNATTDARKLNFMTDQGSSRASVSIACRLAGLRPLIVGFCFCCFCLALFEPRFCQAEETELA